MFEVQTIYGRDYRTYIEGLTAACRREAPGNFHGSGWTPANVAYAFILTATLILFVFQTVGGGRCLLS